MTLADGLQAFWEMDEASGSRIDRVGPYTLSLTAGAVGTETGNVYANAVALRTALDGLTLPYASMPAALNPNGDIDFTLAVWVNPHRWATTFDVYMNVFHHGNFAEGGIHAKTTYENALAFQIFDDTSLVGTAHARLGNTGSDGLNQWNLAIVKLDHVANTWRAIAYPYTAGVGSDPWSIGMFSMTRPITIGTNITDDTPDMGVGPLMIWNRVLSDPTEEVALYNGGAGLTYEALMGGAAPIPNRLLKLPQAVNRAAYW